MFVSWVDDGERVMTRTEVRLWMGWDRVRGRMEEGVTHPRARYSK